VPFLRVQQVDRGEPHPRRRLAEGGQGNVAIGPARDGLLEAAGRDLAKGSVYPGLAPGVSSAEGETRQGDSRGSEEASAVGHRSLPDTRHLIPDTSQNSSRFK